MNNMDQTRALPGKEKSFRLGHYNFTSENRGNLVVALLDDREIARYDTQYEPDGPCSGLEVDKTFWRKPSVEKSEKSGSEVTTLWKTFLPVDKSNYALLIQKLVWSGVSRMHRHTLPEYIFQLGGSSYVLTAPVTDLASYSVHEMRSSEGLFIPPGYFHLIMGGIEGSVTIPIKQTNKNRSDHFYAQEIPERVQRAITIIREKI
jgi:hypothetical protein